MALDFTESLVYNRKTINICIGKNKDTMKKRTRSILEELNSLGAQRNNELIIENRGQTIIESAVNLLTLIRESFNEDEAGELERRFLNAIRTGDTKKFKRGVHKVQEARKNSKNDPLNT